MGRLYFSEGLIPFRWRNSSATTWCRFVRGALRKLICVAVLALD
jgi:hypothetical protein